MSSIQRLASVSFFALVLAASAPAMAQGNEWHTTPSDAQPGEYEARVNEWDVSAGIGVMVRPAYMGANDYVVRPIPLIDARWRDRVYINTREGVGYDIIHNPRARFGFGLGYDTGRDDGAGSGNRLRGLGDIDPTIEARVHASYGFQPFPLWLEGEFRYDLLDGHDGWLTTIGAKYKQRSGENLRISAGPSVTYASDNYMQSYFGVTTAQAANSQFSTYNADSGFRDLSFDASAVYTIDPNWFVHGFGGYRMLVGDANDSPISQTRNNFSTGVSLGYRF